MKHQRYSRRNVADLDSGRHGHSTPISAPRRGGTLLELLVAIGMISLLTGILVPVLGQARERGRAAACLANGRGLGAAMSMYYSEERNLPWFYVHEISEGEGFRPVPGASGFTTFSWGGMLPDIRERVVDSQLTPTELRPLTRYTDPGARGYAVVRTFVCPSDSSVANPSLHAGTASPIPDRQGSNWKEFGNSYSINWHWLRAYAGVEPELRRDDARLMYFGPHMLTSQMGGRASEFLWAAENHLDQLLNVAGLLPGRDAPGVRGIGWHGRPSTHVGMFLDGHSEYRDFDTRYLRGDGWRAAP
ncbi:MAG: hypothetical protein DCC65_10160 [Planctomycetota bacterium]|nr:MAG: hypothetical protein DCC65_10160 [Planctomycetota bacterium]